MRLWEAVGTGKLEKALANFLLGCRLGGAGIFSFSEEPRRVVVKGKTLEGSQLLGSQL